jgi:hypothetical protein
VAVNFSTLVKLPCQDMFAVPVTVSPFASQPGAPAYAARGIFITGPLDVPLVDGSILSDQQTILDARDAEFAVTPPMQGDRINIPFDCNGAPLGEFEVIDASKDGGGLTTLTLRRVESAKPGYR